jgi:hypothetical protein
MAITGKVFQVNDLSAFVASYLQDPANPDPGTFEPLAGARVDARLTSVLSTESPLPGVNTAADGRFTIPTSASPPSNLRVRLLIGRRTTVANIFIPVFRSERVRLSQLLGAPSLELYVASPGIVSRITQSQLNAQVGDLKAQLDLDQLTATIVAGGVRLHAKRGPGTVDCFIRLSRDTSANLDEFVDAAITNMQVDVAFPCSIFANEQAIENQVREGIRDAFEDVNDEIKDEFISAVAEQQGLPAALVASVVDSLVTVTIEELKFPQVGSGRAIEIKPAIGVPRGLRTPAPILPSGALA